MRLRHFRQVATFDPAPALAALSADPEIWRRETWRQDHIASPHPDTETVFLRMPGEISVASVFESHDAEWRLHPGLDPLYTIAREIEREQWGSLARVMAVKLKPGGRILPHTDTGGYAEKTERFHAVLSTNQHSWLTAGDESCHMPAGTVWWFNKHHVHSGGNLGESDRIHLVVDLYVPELRFTVEPFGYVREEIAGLMERHWREIGGTDAQPLDVDWDRFEQLEAAGVLYTLCARDRGGQLAGYVVHIVAPALHYRSFLQAHDDAHYLAPEYRRGLAAVRMLKAAEDMLRAAGVKAVTYHTKLRAGNDRGAVFKRLGYEPVETLYRKAI